MLGDSWTCLAVGNGPGVLSDRVLTILKAAACNLFLKKRERMNILGDEVDGVIVTAWNTQLVGTRSGVLFRAQIDCENGTDYQVNFLLSEDDLGRGAEILRSIEEGGSGIWAQSSTPFPITELYQFYDLGTGRTRTRQ